MQEDTVEQTNHVIQRTFGYNVSKNDTSEALLHAQVAIIADKYTCVSLYKLAITSFANSLKAVKSDEWRVTAAFVYDFMAAELPTHKEIRNLVVTAVMNRYSILNSTLRNENVVDLLRLNADLATDLLLIDGLDLWRKTSATINSYAIIAIIAIVDRKICRT